MILQDISVTILAKNSEKYLKEVLKALAPFSEIIIGVRPEILRFYPECKDIAER